MNTNPLIQELIDLEIINPARISEFFPRVRDRDDVSVLRCRASGVIFLNRVDHINDSYYSEKEGVSYWSAPTRAAAVLGTAADDARRFDRFRSLVTDKRYCDVGCGAGGGLERFAGVASSATGVELQADLREKLCREGLNVVGSLEGLERDFDVISLFHVLEHLPRPLEALRALRRRLKVGGKVIIEVPHARDALLTSYDLDTFKAFTLWSEHLVLHTRESLRIYLEASGFKNIEIQGEQRFPLANHLGWLRNGLPGGQEVFKQFATDELTRAYAEQLQILDQTDTLIAIAEV